MKKVTALFITLALIVGLCACAPSATSRVETVTTAGPVVASGDCGENVTWTFGSDGLLTISGSGPMKTWKEETGLYFIPWYADNYLIKKAVIEEGVTSIGGMAFSGCSYLTSVTIPDSVTSIDDSAFSGCNSLTSVIIPDSVTSIGDSAFGGCSSLTSVIIPDSVTGIGERTFSGCSGLTSVIIPDGATSVGGYAFYSCSNLTSVTIPDSVTSIGDSAFSNCTELTSMTIPNSVTSIGQSAFWGCSSLTDVYYGGSENQWEQIDIDTITSGNDPLLNATIHYNS